MVRLLKLDYRMLLLDDRVRGMLDFAVRVARDVHSINPQTVEDLRAKGLADEDILNVVEVAGFFSYYTRVADALGVQPESNPVASTKIEVTDKDPSITLSQEEGEK